MLPKQIFITGTDTGVGKTVIAAILTAGLNALYWKPIQSGLKEETDTEIVQKLTALPDRYFLRETYRLAQPLSPHASAALEKVTIDLDEIILPEQCKKESVIVEGAGGVLAPLNNNEFIVDLIIKLGLPVLLVAKSGLGTINHTLLSLEVLRNRMIPIIGVVMNGKSNKINRKAIEHYGQIPVVAEVELIDTLGTMDLKLIFNEKFT